MYKLFKTIKKTARENKLYHPQNCKFLVDLSILENKDVPEEDYKDMLEELIHLSPAFTELFPMKVGEFHAYNAILQFQCHRIYSIKELYCIYELKYVLYSGANREGVYDKNYDKHINVFSEGKKDSITYPVEYELPLKTVKVSVKSLYDVFGNELSYGKVIQRSFETGDEHYAILSAVGNVLCTDNEQCDILTDDRSGIKLVKAGIESETNTVFRLTAKERDIAIYV